jgi:lysyl-tRNA synthetase, class II
LEFEPLDQFQQRRKKLSDIEALGHAAYPRKFAWSHTARQIAEQFGSRTAEELTAEPVNVRVAGRIIALRPHGKAAFAHMVGDGVRLQIYVKLDAVGEQAYKLFQLLDLGDIVGICGHLFRTKTNELTVWVEKLELLSKALLPLPEKWHGLADMEQRFRRRYVDLIVNERTRETFLRRAQIIREIRQFFESRGYMEVETPMMHPILGGATARPFVTHHNTFDMDLYLRIAPELYLKRLVVGGFDRVYEINRNFRNEGLGWRWNPEFTMLEFYQAYTDYQGVMDLTQEIVTQCAKDVTGGTITKWTVGEGEKQVIHEVDWANWRRMTMREAVIHYWPQGAGATPTVGELTTQSALARRLGEASSTLHATATSATAWQDSEEVKKARIQHLRVLSQAMADVISCADIGKVIAMLFEAFAEEHLMQPTIIYEFPTAISPLSKQKPDEPDWTERFEIYVGQMEISNGFSELNDPEDQRRRFEGQLRERERGDEEAHQMDEDYIRALAYGMPPAGGVGVGVDRLCMLLTDSHTIRDVILFPLLRPEKFSTTEDTGDTEKG